MAGSTGAPTGSHAHGATQGTITRVPVGTGFGEFCNGPKTAPPKRYTVK